MSSTKYRVFWPTLLYTFLVLANMWLVAMLICLRPSDQIAKTQFSYIGDDYPTRLPIDIPVVEMTFGETVHYQSEGLAAAMEWQTLVPSTHLGYVRLSRDKRLFAIAMFHELHCVNTFRRALASPEHTPYTQHHVQHCLNYLRQLFLCAADTTLEPYDFQSRNYTWDRVGVTRECRDWSTVYMAAADNHDDWLKFLVVNGTYAVPSS